MKLDGAMVNTNPIKIEAAVFDVFGTVVDWRSGISAAAARIGGAAGVQADWIALTEAWRDKYRPALDSVLRGERPWRNWDVVHRETLEEVLKEQSVHGFDDGHKAELVRSWYRLPPWPDVIPGLGNLRRTILVSTLSNAHVGLLARLVKHSGLPFDLILSAELAHTFKPDAAAFETAIRLLDLPPDRVLKVAAHQLCLRGAQAVGMRTAYVPRPLEWGPNGRKPEPIDPSFDIVASDFLDLAAQLNASRTVGAPGG